MSSKPKKSAVKATKSHPVPVKKAVALKAATATKGTAKPHKGAPSVPVNPTVAPMTETRRAQLLAKASKGPYGRYVQHLLNIRDRLLDEIEFHASDNLKRTQKEASSDLSAYSFHMADAGTDNFDREFALSMVSNEQELLNEVNDAIKRLESGTYGICEMSGKPISKARLTAIPWARCTVECQSELERTHQKRVPQTFRPSDFGNSEDEVVEKEEED